GVTVKASGPPVPARVMAPAPALRLRTPMPGNETLARPPPVTLGVVPPRLAVTAVPLPVRLATTAVTGVPPARAMLLYGWGPVTLKTSSPARPFTVRLGMDAVVIVARPVSVTLPLVAATVKMSLAEVPLATSLELPARPVRARVLPAPMPVKEMGMALV